MKQYVGENLTCLTLNELNQLEEQLESSVNKVRVRKVMRFAWIINAIITTSILKLPTDIIEIDEAVKSQKKKKYS